MKIIYTDKNIQVLPSTSLSETSSLFLPVVTFSPFSFSPAFLFVLPFPKSDLSTPLFHFPRKTALPYQLYLPPNIPKLSMILENYKKISVYFTLGSSRKDL